MKKFGAGTLLFVILIILLSRYVYVEDKIKKSNEIKKLLIEDKKTQEMLKDAFEGIGYGIE